jgi:Mce-associated membrane protein
VFLKTLVGLFRPQRGSVKCQVPEAGIVRSDARSARVLVVAASKVTNIAAPEGQARTYRLQLDLAREAGSWLTSDVAFAG